MIKEALPENFFEKVNTLFSFFVLGIFLLNCSGKADKKSAKAKISLPVTTLITKRADLHRLYVGDLNAFQNVEIRARVQGYLEKIYVDEGKDVKKGQVLFQLSNNEYVSQLNNAKASYKKAVAEARASELDLKRIKMLVSNKVVSPTELELAEASLEAFNASIDKALSSIENAETKLSYTTIRSPFDGILDRIPFKIGSLISEGSLLTTISDLRSITAYFNVSEKDYLDYIKNKINGSPSDSNMVRLILADGSNYPYTGKLEKIDGSFQENTGTMSFRANFPNPDKILKHGSSGMIEVTNHMEDALIVPQKSTFELQDKVYVYLVDDSNRVKMTNFIAKKRFQDYYIVQSGLKRGDRVVFEGIQKVKEGMVIHPLQMLPDSVSRFSTLDQFIKE